MVKKSKLVDVLANGTKAALDELAARLAEEIEAERDPTKRLPLVRAFLAVLRDIEAGRVREARQARVSGSTATTTGAPDPLDELTARRRGRLA